MIISSSNSLENNKIIVNDMNVFPVPDGDTGTNMSLTLIAAVEDILAIDTSNISEVSDRVAIASLRGARGNSGVILSQLFRGFAKYLRKKDFADAKVFAKAIKEGVNTAYRAVMKPTEGTILTVAREFADKALEISKDNKDIIDVMEMSIDHAKQILNKTPEMLPVLKQAGVVDAGGQGLIYILEGAIEVIKSDKIIERLDGQSVLSKPQQKTEVIEDMASIKFTYCTEFLINKNGKRFVSNTFQKNISKHGDSTMVIDDEKFVKVHMHTNNPGIIIEQALQYGSLEDIKIDNMKIQHSHKHLKENDNDKKENKKYGLITVGVGEGIIKILKDLGVDTIIEGGQTMNPSTHEILNAVNNIMADTIFLFPNNKNIILAAEQAKSMSDKNVLVIPTKNVSQAISCLLSFDYNADQDTNIKNMKSVMESIKTASITYAVRDSSIDNKNIKKGDILGIIDDKIEIVSNDISDVCTKLFDILIDDESEIITVFYGEDIREKEAMELFKKIENKYLDCDFEIHSGNQPLYHYIISIE
jgi:DAK2 domain fusion protein YloV